MAAAEPERELEPESEPEDRSWSARLRGVSYRLSRQERRTRPARPQVTLVFLSSRPVMPPAPGQGMTTDTKRPGAHPFIALEVSLQVVASLRPLVAAIRKQEPSIATQIVRAASSICANLAEGNRRQGKDRTHFFRIAAGSAEETRAHLRVALAWRWVSSEQIAQALALLDRELALLWRLTH